MPLPNPLIECWSRHRGLAAVGLLNLTAAAVFLVLMLIDDTTVLGIDRWIKPAKFGFSVGLYLWTVAWFLPSLRIGRGPASAIGWTIAVLMFFENLLIFTQAIRGTRSHFNFDTPLDGTIFGWMGILVLLNTVMLVVLTALFVFRAADGPRPWIWSIRIGLFILLLGSGVGGFMISNGGHSVGAEDGGPGLPVVHWNANTGDLRVAHLIGLHGIQVIPFVAFLLGRTRMNDRRQLAVIVAFSVGYALLGGLLFWQAIEGIPLLSVRS
ncbi:MAG: hypothetical protein P8P71_10000 [Phycisphaerales bacterium]|nr:hypothetical protein [Phycisphaerales bacterium]